MSLLKVILRNPLDHADKIDYNIIPNNTQLAKDWQYALYDILENKLPLNKDFCFLGFPHTHRNIEFLCNELNKHVEIINRAKIGYVIEDWFCPNSVMFDDSFNDEITFWKSLNLESPNPKIKHSQMNRLHNHFEVLQGTVENISHYYLSSSPEVRYSIGQLNTLCHEIESLIISLDKLKNKPEWVRPTQITSFSNAPRMLLTDEHRQGFIDNGFDRVFGGVYMHWCQIGKTHFEVWRDEHAPALTDTICQAIMPLKYYSGEFDIEWGRSIGRFRGQKWNDRTITAFETWLIDNNLNPKDPQLSLGYLPIGQVDLINSFGTENEEKIWKILGNHLDICGFELIIGSKRISMEA